MKLPIFRLCYTCSMDPRSQSQIMHENSKDVRVEAIDSWCDFDDIARHYQTNSDQPFAFRGQENADWTLFPSLVRSIGQGLQKKTGPPDMMIETEIRDLESNATNEYTNAKRNSDNEWARSSDLVAADQVSVWEHMQHYGAPTRLLDWTKSIYVAAYFASNSLLIDGKETDGVIWLVNYQRVNELASSVQIDPFGGTDSAVMAAEITGPGSPVIAFREPKRIAKNERAERQQGIHSVCRLASLDHGVIIRYLQHIGTGVIFAKALISAHFKAELRARMESHSNLTHYDLLPGDESAGKASARYLESSLEARSPARDWNDAESAYEIARVMREYQNNLSGVSLGYLAEGRLSTAQHPALWTGGTIAPENVLR